MHSERILHVTCRNIVESFLKSFTHNKLENF